MTSEEFIEKRYQYNDAYNSIGCPMIVRLKNGKEAVTFVEGHNVRFFDEYSHPFAVYEKGVDY